MLTRRQWLRAGALIAGGTRELARFVQALAARSLQRYVVSLADADLGLWTPLGASQAMPLVLTQVVPNPRNVSLPLGRRDLLRLLERPTASPARAALADEVRRRPDADIDGHALRFGNGRLRGSSYVTQTMVTRDGRLIG